MVKKFVNKLPVVLQTDTQKEFFSATFDQLFSPAEVKQAQGFIGRRSSDVFSPGVDNYLGEPTKNRAAYQLEPIAYAVNQELEDTNEMFYEDLLNYLNYRGGNTLNHDRLFADNFYSFAPPIDVDKYLNYQNYIWLPDGAPIIYIQYVGSGGGAAFDTIIEDQIIGAAAFNTSEHPDLRPRGLELSSGMRIRFEGSASYDRNLYIEAVGRQITLVEELTTLLPGDTINNILWDNSIIFDGGTGYTMLLTAINSIIDGGTGYTVSDVLTIQSPGGEGVTTEATITVDTIGGGGAITAVSITTAGDYLFAPLGPVEVTGGTGSGATFDVTIESAQLTVDGGTFTVQGVVQPTELGASGEILKAEYITRGTYSVPPTNPATLSGGTGSGASIEWYEFGDEGELFDSSFGETFDASVSTDLTTPDYLTIERGSIEGSPWTRTNRWFNVDIINTTQSLGQILDAIIISGGIGYSVGDVLPVIGDGINGTVTVTAVNGVGTITGVRVSGRGQGYSYGGIDQTGVSGSSVFVEWDQFPIGINLPHGSNWDISFAWDQQVFAGAGTGAVIDITLATSISKSNKARRPILEFRMNLQLFEFGNKFIREVQLVADTETISDLEGQTAYVIDGIPVVDGTTLIFLDPSSVPNFLEWDDEPDSGNPGPTYWDTTPWEAEGSAGAVSRFIWQVDLSSGVIALNKVDPFTGVVGPSANPVPVGGVVLAQQGNDYAGDSFYQYQDPITFAYTWRQGQLKTDVNQHPLYELYDINAIGLADVLVYPDSTFVGNELFSYRILTAADLADTGGTLQADPILGFPLTLKGLRQVSDIVFENDLETNRVDWGTPATEIPGYYFYREWTVDAYGNIITAIEDNVQVQQSQYKTNWQTSSRAERQRVIDRFLTETDDEDTFTLSANPVAEAGAILVAQGRRLNTDEFAFIPESRQLILFDKPTDTGFAAADGFTSLFSFPALIDPVEVFVDDVYQVRGEDYQVVESLQLENYIINTPGTGYAVDDLLTVLGGTFTTPAQVRVVSVGGLGQVLGLAISNRGVYTTLPANPFALSGGSGLGLFLEGEWIDATGGVFTIQFMTGPVSSGSLVEAREQGSGAPGANSVVEIIYTCFDPIVEEDRGFFEIPNGLENNPNNREIIEQSWNEFAPHMVSIIENQFVYLGTAFGSVNNYRDTLKDGSQGTFILQSQAPLLKTMLVTSENSLDLIEAMRMNSREYARYRNKFLKTAKQMIDQGFESFNDGDSINTDQWVDEAVRRIIRSREFATAFQDTHMIAWNTVYEEETAIATGVDQFNTFTIFTDLTNKQNVMYVYLDGVLQVIDADYTITNFNPIQIRWTTIPSAAAEIVVRLFEDSAPAHIPATPAKLGILSPSRPHIELDSSYRNPVSVIVGHDGSRTPVFNDYRDDLLLEFETRIYNGILDKFRNDYNLPLEEDTLRPGKFRETRWAPTEWERLVRPAFFKWVAAEKADYITNEFYDVNDEWTWNYSEVQDVDGDFLPGYWRGIFDYYYDTQTPHTTPWEMLGFVSQPDWWAVAPNTGDGFSGYGNGPWPNTHPMWEDLEDGLIRRGYRAGIDNRYARPGLVSDYIPVDMLGDLKATPLECIDTSASLQGPTTVQAAKGWQYGDLAPVEYAWRIGEQYPFAISEAMFLARPGEFGEQFWDPEHIFNVPARPSQVVSDDNDVYKRLGNSVLYVHGETKDGVYQVNTGYQVWISCRLRALNKNLGQDFGQLLRTLDVKLGHKMASFTDKDTLRVFVEGISVSSNSSNLLIPAENITVSLHTSPPVNNYFYGGVLVRTQADGTFQIFGYDILAGEFNYVPRIQDARSSAINVGGQPEAFTNFVAGTTYNKDQIVRYNTIFYRALVAHEATNFDISKWQKLSKLPITGGINVTYKPTNDTTVAQLQYGDQLDTVQDVFDFLVGWGAYLEQQGWDFSTVNSETGNINNWLTSAKDFLLWVDTNWAPNSIIMLSPSAEHVVLNAQEGYPAAVEKIINGVYAILDKNGVVIDPINTIVKRDGRNIIIEPSIQQTGIYATRINTTDTESIITFDNTTDFNDVIYDPLLGTRLARLIFQGRRTSNWTGKLEAGGYIITEDGLIPNFENLVNSIRLYHDTETSLDNPVVEDAARHLIGFTERDYFDDLQVLDDGQYQFYKGMIRQKGTVRAIRKLERSNIVGEEGADMAVYEEWALRTSKYGNVCGNQLLELLIAANEVKVDPQLVQLSYPASNLSGNTTYFTYTSLDDVNDEITITSHGFETGDLVLYTDISKSATSPIAPLTSGQIYSIIAVDNNTISLANPSTPDTALNLINAIGLGSDYYSFTVPTNGVVRAINVVSSGNVYATIPTVIIENHPDDTQGAGATAIAVLDSDDTLLRIDITNPGYGYTKPPRVYLDTTVLTGTEDRAIALLQFEITVDEPNDDVIIIDVDDASRWITRPAEIACNISTEIFPETSPIPGEYIISAEVSSPGTGYAVDDILLIQGGALGQSDTSSGRPARLRVLEVSAGAIVSVKIEYPGAYLEAPEGVVAVDNSLSAFGQDAEFTVVKASKPTIRRFSRDRTLPNAGNVSISDTNFHHVSTVGLDALRDLPAPPGTITGKGETIHVAYDLRKTWAVYALNTLDATLENLEILSQLDDTNAVYSLGRVILTQELTGVAEDLPLQSPTLTIDTNSSGQVSNVRLVDTGYGYWADSFFTITDQTLSGYDNAVIRFSSNGGEMVLDLHFTTIAGQDETDFNNVGLNGTFVAGTGYTGGDTITLSDGTVVQVNTTSSGPPGPVATFQINVATITAFPNPEGTVLTQVSTTGGGSGFTLTLGVANAELAAPLGGGYTASQTGVPVAASDIPGPAQSGVYLANSVGGGTGKLYANNILYDYSYTGWDTATTSVIASRGTGYSISDEISGNGGVFVGSPAVWLVDSVRSIAGQDETDFSGVAPNGAFAGGTGYAVSDNITLDDGTTIVVDAEVGGAVTEFTITASGGALEVNQDTIRQATTDGSGTGFELTMGPANEEVFETTLLSGGAYTTVPNNPVTVNGGTGSGATFTLGGYLPLYDIAKDGVGVEDDTFDANTQFYILTNLRVRDESVRDVFEDVFLQSGARYVWLDDGGNGNWAVHNLTVPVLTGQDETDYTGAYASGTTGTFLGGLGHVALDVLVLSNGTVITVDAVGPDGDVTEFTVTTAGSNIQLGDELLQVSTSGGGINFVLIPDYANIDASSISYTVRAERDELIETDKFKNAFVYEADSKDTIVQLPVYDPFKGLIPGPADLNIRYRSNRDPARYNVAATDVLRSDTRLFGSEQVGYLWWDLSTCAYLYYEMGTDSYRRDNWGKLIDGSTIDIYEWVRSSVPPAQWEKDGTPRSTTEYVESQEYDVALEEVRTYYYFWVKDRTEVPDGANRTIAAFEVARLLTNPAGQQFQWFSPVSQSGFVFSGIDGVFTDSDNVFQINYRRTEVEEPYHVEWELAREGDPDYEISIKHWNKMVDSLCGFTDLLPINSSANSDTVATFATTAGVDDGTEVITTDAAHGFTSGDGVFYSKDSGIEDIGLTDGVMYYVNVISATTLSLHVSYTDAIADASRINLTGAGAETHTLTKQSSSLKNFNNAIPSALDPSMGYLVVPDPSLSSTMQLGIKTRPLQGMFADILSARRIFVEKVNDLVEFINLRDENPTWNADLSTNNLWEWVDWYAEGYSVDNAIPTYQVSDTNDLQNITTITDGDFVKVTGTRPRIYVYDAELDRFTMISRKDSRLSLLPTIYENDIDLTSSIELRQIIAALKDNVFVQGREVNNNLIYFALLNYVFTEQEDVDWAFKTTYLFLKQQGRVLRQDRVFQEDPFDSALEYIMEAKPYQSKVRDFRIERSTEIDLLPGTAEEIARNFYISLLYDRIRGGDLSLAEVRAAKRESELDASWKGYAEYDGGTTLMRLGAAGRFVASQRDLLSSIADVDSDVFEAYSTEAVQATFTIDTNVLGQVSAVSITNAGRGYYANGLMQITDSTLTGNDNAIISYTVNLNDRGSIASAIVLNPGNGYTPSQVAVPVALDNLPVPTSANSSTDELEAVAEINLRITDTFADDFEGLYITNTLFTGNPTLIGATIYESVIDFATGAGVDGGTEEITTSTAHGFTTGDDVQYINNGGAENIGLTNNSLYFVNVISATEISLHTSYADAVSDSNRIDLTASGAEVHSFIRQGTGINYVVDEILQMGPGSGTPISNALFRVVSVGNNGQITELQLVNGGSYQQTPTVDPVSLLGGSGTDASVTALIFETSGTVPFDSTPFDAVGFDSSENDPTVDVLEGTAMDTHATIVGQTQNEFTGLPGFGTYIGGDGAGGTAYRPAESHAFDTDAAGVDAGTDVITTNGAHPFITGDFVMYSRNAGVENIGIADGAYVYLNVLSATTLSVHTTLVDALADTNRIDLTDSGAETHLLMRDADRITLSDSTVVRVEAVNGNGDVTEFVIVEGSEESVDETDVLTQVSTTGTGVGFEITLDVNNVTYGTFFAVPPEETFSGDGNTREFELTTDVPTFFLFAVVDGVELRRNIDYFFVAGNVFFVVAPNIGVDNVQIYTYIEAGDLINPQVDEGITEEMVPLSPLENFVLIADTVSSGAALTVDNLTFSSAGTITRGAGDFTADGIVAGQAIEVSGTASNDGYYTVDNVTALVLTLADREVLVNEGPVATTISDTVSISFRIHEDPRRGLNYFRNADTYSTLTTDTVTTSQEWIPVTDEEFSYAIAVDATYPTLNAPGVAWLGTERVEYHDVAPGYLLSVRRGTLGTHPQEHAAGTRVFDGNSEQLLTDPETYWVESASPNVYNGTNGQWRFVGEGQDELSVVHFSDTVASSFAANVSIGDTLVVLSTTNVDYQYNVHDLISIGELGVVTITSPGTGYAVGDVIDIDSVATGGTGVTAEVGAVDVGGGIVYVRITNRGTGYTDVGAVSVADTEIASANGTGAAMNAFFDTEGLVLSQPHRLVDPYGVVAEEDTVSWRVDEAFAGGLSTSTGTVAAFLQAEPGNGVGS